MSINLIGSISINNQVDFNNSNSNDLPISEFNYNAKPFIENNNINQSISTPSINEIDGYLFDIYEEDNYLFLFLKVFDEDRFKTICVQIEEPRYYLYFYPTEKDKKDNLIDEVREIATKCGGYLIEPKKRMFFYQTKSYAFDNDQVPKEGEWLCASFSRKSDLSVISPIGQNYKFVFGITNRLIDCFCTHNLIKGPRWVHISKLENADGNKYTNIPTFKIKNPKRVTIINDDNKKIPTFNICSMALRYTHDTISNEYQILMISIKIRDQCDIENYKSAKKRVTFVKTDKDLASSIDNVISCNNESELLELFFDTIDECDVDLICSYNLSNGVNILKKRMTELNIDDKCRIGRMKFVPATSTTPAHHPRGGRLLCDLRSMCDEFIKCALNSFNYIVAQEFDNIYRQPLEQIDILTEIKKISKLISLIKYNVRDTSFVDALMKKMNLLPLTLQLSQLSGCHWYRILGGSTKGGGPSSRCESLFVHTFSELGYIIPEKYSQTTQQQQISPNIQVIENDEADTTRRRGSQYKGGLVLEPKIGFYDNCVLVLDFNSLYPSIIREYNLCFTTILNERPESDEARIELALSKTQNRNQGILPSIMANLLEARLKVKKELSEVEKHISHVTTTTPTIKNSNNNNNNNEEKSWILKEKRLKIQSQAIKILANAMYGYLGFPYSRFPAIHIAEMVTCLGREILSSTVDKITQMGHTVIYGDTDSVMIRTNTKDWKEAMKTAEMIGQQISSQYKFLNLGVESIFMKFLLLNKKKYASLVFEPTSIQENNENNENKNDENNVVDDDDFGGGVGLDEKRYSKEIRKHTWLKIKGLEIIRREWCPLSKYLSNFALESFMYSSNQSEASNLILDEIKRITSMLMNDGQPTSSLTLFNAKHGYDSYKLKTEITVDDLIITKGITKSLDQYKSTDKTFNVTVGRWMEKKGYHVRASDAIPYIVIDNKAKEAEKRAKHPDIVYNVCEADIEWYLTSQLLPPLLRICEPFEAPKSEMIENAFGLFVTNPKSIKKTYKMSNSSLSLLNSNPEHKILTQLYFTCPLCNTQSLVKNLLSKSSIPKIDSDFSPVICPSCNQSISWKAASNSMILFIKQQLEKWGKSFVTCDCGFVCELCCLPLIQEHKNRRGKICNKPLKADISNADILKTLTSFHKLFRDVKIVDNKDLASLCDQMSYYLMEIISMHGLNRVKFNSIINVQPFNSLSSE